MSNEPHPQNRNILAQLQMREEEIDARGGTVYPRVLDVRLPHPMPKDGAPQQFDSFHTNNAGLTVRDAVAKELFVALMPAVLSDFTGETDADVDKELNSHAFQCFDAADIFVAELLKRGGK